MSPGYKEGFLAYYICRPDLAYVSPGIAHVGCLYPQWFEIHHVVKVPGRATIAAFLDLDQVYTQVNSFCSVCECTIKSQCRTPYTEPTVRSIILPTISCEPGTAKVYLKKIKKKKKKLDKTKHWGIKTAFEGLWIYSVSGIPRQNENKNKMVHMGIEPGTRDSQANALTVTPRHLHLVLTSF